MFDIECIKAACITLTDHINHMMAHKTSHVPPNPAVRHAYAAISSLLTRALTLENSASQIALCNLLHGASGEYTAANDDYCPEEPDQNPDKGEV